MLIIDKDINKELQSQYLGAKTSIEIIAYSITRPRKTSHKLFLETWNALRQAIINGVETRVILENWNESNPQHLENLKVKTALESYGAQVKLAKKGVCMHSKTWLIDNKTLIIGSHNSTEAGLMRTKNLSIMVQQASAIKQYRDYFQSEWDII